MTYLIHPKPPRTGPDGGIRSRAIANHPWQGEVFWKSDHRELAVGFRFRTWELLVPEAERRQLRMHDNAKYEPWRRELAVDPDRYAALGQLLRGVWGEPGEDRVSVPVPPGSLGVFRDLFRTLLAKAQAGDEIEVVPEQPSPLGDAFGTATIPAQTTPSQPIRDELEAIAAAVPELGLDPAKDAA